jgi:hypothetical protein
MIVMMMMMMMHIIEQYVGLKHPAFTDALCGATHFPIFTRPASRTVPVLINCVSSAFQIAVYIPFFYIPGN